MANILKRVDIYRDGGSISVTYECDDHFCRCTLFFQIDSESIDFRDGAYIRQFEYAELQEYHQFQWTSKKTGVINDDLFMCALRVSWETARQILIGLAPQTFVLSEDDRERFDEMVNIANSE